MQSVVEIDNRTFISDELLVILLQNIVRKKLSLQLQQHVRVIKT